MVGLALSYGPPMGWYDVTDDIEVCDTCGGVNLAGCDGHLYATSAIYSPTLKACTVTRNGFVASCPAQCTTCPPTGELNPPLSLVAHSPPPPQGCTVSGFFVLIAGTTSSGSTTSSSNTFTATTTTAPAATTTTVESSAGQVTITVVASDARCPWTATANCPWVRIAVVAGLGNMSFPISWGSTVAARQCTLTVAGSTLVVSQSFSGSATLAITAPTASSPVSVGVPFTIRYSTNIGTWETVTIQLSFNGGSTWSTLAAGTAAIGRFIWTPLVGSSSAALLVSRDLSPSLTFAQSGLFRISNINVYAPSAAAVWRAPTAQIVNWTHNFGSSQAFDVLLSVDSGVTFPYTLATSILATSATAGSASVTPPSATSRSGGAVVKVCQSPCGSGDFGRSPSFITLASTCPSAIETYGDS